MSLYHASKRIQEMFKEYHVLKIFCYLTFQLNTLREQIFANTNFFKFEADCKGNTKTYTTMHFLTLNKCNTRKIL